MTMYNKILELVQIELRKITFHIRIFSLTLVMSFIFTILRNYYLKYTFQKKVPSEHSDLVLVALPSVQFVLLHSLDSQHHPFFMPFSLVRDQVVNFSFTLLLTYSFLQQSLLNISQKPRSLELESNFALKKYSTVFIRCGSRSTQCKWELNG